MMEAKQQGIVATLSQGAVHVPGLVLQHYARLGLTEVEVLILIHLTYFMTQEHIFFPTPQQLAQRMSTPESRVLTCIERLVRERFLGIELTTEETGKYGERYDLTPFYEKLATIHTALDVDTEKVRDGVLTEGTDAPLMQEEGEREATSIRRRNLFTLFESEFARPLSPFEYEMIVGWIDRDTYSDSLIMTALKEAVFAGKLSFRYVDRILNDWQRQGIRTVEEAKQSMERFRR
jgi:DNA replication protein